MTDPAPPRRMRRHPGGRRVVTATIAKELHERLRSEGRHLNMSAVCETALRAALDGRDPSSPEVAALRAEVARLRAVLAGVHAMTSPAVTAALPNPTENTP